MILGRNSEDNKNVWTEFRIRERLYAGVYGRTKVYAIPKLSADIQGDAES
jgi:hypothetical protein